MSKNRDVCAFGVALVAAMSTAGCAATAPMFPPASVPTSVPAPATTAAPVPSTPAVATPTARPSVALSGTAMFQGAPLANAAITVEDVLAGGTVVVVAPGGTLPPSGVWADGSSLGTDANGNFNIRLGNVQPDTVLRVSARAEGAAVTTLAMFTAGSAAYRLAQGGSDPGIATYGLGLDQTSTVFEVIANGPVNMAKGLKTPVATQVIGELMGGLVKLGPQVASAVTAPSSKTLLATDPACATAGKLKPPAPKTYCNYRLLVASAAQYVPPPPSGGTTTPANISPPGPGSTSLAPGLHLTVTDGAIVVTNNGGSLGFQAGQFGYVPSVNQPPVIVPSNPNIQFVPPPSFNSGAGGPTTSLGPGQGQATDCIVRYALEATDCASGTKPLAENNDAVIKQLVSTVPGLQQSVDQVVTNTVKTVGIAASNPSNVVNPSTLTSSTLVGTNVTTTINAGQFVVTNNSTHETITTSLTGPTAGTTQVVDNRPPAGGGSDNPPRNPGISSVSPASGPLAGGNTITINGTNLFNATAVTIGDTAASGVAVVDNGKVTAIAPAHAAGAVNVVVSTPNGSVTAAGAYTYSASPTITALSPTGGPYTGGNALTIDGTNLSGTTGVTIAGNAATALTVVSDSRITVTVPSFEIGAYDVVVTTPNGTATATYTYDAKPTITAISPTSGFNVGGAVITLTGTNLLGATSLTIGGEVLTAQAQEFEIVDDNHIRLNAPPHAPGPVTIVVTTPDGTAEVTFTYTPSA